jgi:hypothetical protein
MVIIQNKLQGMLDTVLNPQGQPISKERPESTFIRISKDKKMEMDGNHPEKGGGPLTLAPRLDSLDGKTIYLVDETFGGGYEFLTEMQDWLSRNVPSVKTVLKRKKGNMFVDDPELWSEIKEKGDAMVLGVGG